MSRSFVVEPGDKATPVTAYLAQGVIRGELVCREVIRVSSWLRTPGLPEYAAMYDLTWTRGVGTGEPQVLELAEIHVPIAQIMALHLTPPGQDPVEYDANEQNRKLEPIAAICGPFRFDGLLRLPGHLTVAKQMALLREPFLMLYEVTVTSALDPNSTVKVPMLLLRPSACVFAPGKAA